MLWCCFLCLGSAHAAQQAEDETLENLKEPDEEEVLEVSDTESEEEAYPLHAMVRENHLKAVKAVFHANNALLNQADDQGRLPIDYATAHTKLYQWLKRQHQPVTQKGLKVRLVRRLRVPCAQVDVGSAAGQVLVREAGIKSGQKGAKFSVAQKGITYLWLNLSDNEQTTFMKYYKEQFPGFIRAMQPPKANEIWTIFAVDTDMFYYQVAAALGTLFFSVQRKPVDDTQKMYQEELSISIKGVIDLSGMDITEDSVAAAIVAYKLPSVSDCIGWLLQVPEDERRWVREINLSGNSIDLEGATVVLKQVRTWKDKGFFKNLKRLNLSVNRLYRNDFTRNNQAFTQALEGVLASDISVDVTGNAIINEMYRLLKEANAHNKAKVSWEW